MHSESRDRAGKNIIALTSFYSLPDGYSPFPLITAACQIPTLLDHSVVGLMMEKVGFTSGLED